MVIVLVQVSLKEDLESRISMQVADLVGYTRKTCEEMGKESQKDKEPIKQ